jgi:hypothetical protein
MEKNSDPRPYYPPMTPPWSGPWWPWPPPMYPMPTPPSPTPTPFPLPYPNPGPLPPLPTRGALSPDEFPAPAPTGAPIVPGAPAPAALSPLERDLLRRALAIVKEGRAAIAARQLSPLDTYRVLAAYAYVAGFLEARGFDQLGAFLTTIPAATSSSSADLDRFIATTDALIEHPDTRLGPLAALAIGVAGCAIWDGIKWVAGKVTE